MLAEPIFLRYRCSAAASTGRAIINGQANSREVIRKLLTRLKVQGFKNLVDVDLRFGPFTCIAGANGVGKSNLLDVITFLSSLADRPLVEAAMSVRSDSTRYGDVSALFTQQGEWRSPNMRFEAEMIVPREGVDELGQTAKATTTFLRYVLELRLREPARGSVAGPLEVVHEELVHVRYSDAKRNLSFSPSAAWIGSVIPSTRRSAPYISTEGEGSTARVLIHLDGAHSGKPRPFIAENLPRTVLSTTTALENRTAALARIEMRSWRFLQLEPSALRKADSFNSPVRLGPDGGHLASALYYLAHRSPESPEAIYGHLAKQVSQLVEDIREVYVERDPKRETMALRIRTRDGTDLPAHALSDGTLRFLALSFIDLDPDTTGVLCLEEPENGIHPARLPDMLALLKGIACNITQAVDDNNPLRQVIVNTHSPSLTMEVSPEDLVLAKAHDVKMNAGRYSRGVGFFWLSDTWRAKADPDHIAPIGDILPYLNSVSPRQLPLFGEEAFQRVADRADVTAALR